MAANHCRRTIRQLVFTVKRYYRHEWGDELARAFHRGPPEWLPGPRAEVSTNKKLVGNYLRVGYRARRFVANLQAAARIFIRRTRCRWRTISRASVVLPSEPLTASDPRSMRIRSVKLVANCEALLFQRPDDADPTRSR